MYKFDTTTEIMNDFSKKIKFERIKQKITQEDFSIKSGITLSTYKTFENKGKGSFGNFIKILKAFGKEDQLKQILEEELFSPKSATLNKKELNQKKRVRTKQVFTKEDSNDKKITKIGSLLNRLQKKANDGKK